MAGRDQDECLAPLGAERPLEGRQYQARFDELAAAGVDVHGEAALVMGLAPASVLDAGCGTGRVAIELARRGIDVVGVDAGPSMVAEARRRAPQLNWVEADMGQTDLGRTFDVVVMAGNVPLFCPAPVRLALVRSCARHVRPGGALVSGFQLGRGYDLDEYDGACGDEGLALADRWASWDRQPFTSGGAYAVSVHHRPAR